METTESYQDYADRVRRAVQASPVTVAELSRRIGKARSYIHNVLAGRFMSRPVLRAVERELEGEEHDAPA